MHGKMYMYLHWVSPCCGPHASDLGTRRRTQRWVEVYQGEQKHAGYADVQDVLDTDKSMAGKIRLSNMRGVDESWRDTFWGTRLKCGCVAPFRAV